MNGCDLENQSWIGTIKFSPANRARAGFRTSCTEAYSMPMGCPDRQRKSKRCAAGQWSMSLTRLGVAKLRAAVKAMLKQYEGAQGFRWLLNAALQALPGRPQYKLQFSSLFGR
jgi:hypothetical protein